MLVQLSSPMVAGPSGQTFDYYIGTAGNDSNPGTLLSPWAISSLRSGNTNQAAMAGKRVGLIAGTYNIYSYLQSNDNGGYTVALNIPNGTGTSTPTVVGSCNASGIYTRGAAVLECSNSGTITTINNPVIGQTSTSAQYITIDGLKIQNAGSKVVYFGTYGSNYNMPGIVIQYCEITGQNTSPSKPSDAVPTPAVPELPPDQLALLLLLALDG